MSRLAEFRQLEQKLAAQLAELEAMKNDGALKTEIEFEQKLRALMGEYGVSLKDVINLLDPQVSRRASAPAASGQRKARELKVYVNPKSGERVETKGGNHKVLKAWKDEHGSDLVEGWRIK